MNEYGDDYPSPVTEMRRALAAYGDEAASDSDFIPTTALYRLYAEWRARTYQRIDPNRPVPLTHSEFGTLLRYVFPRSSRRRRSYHGVLSWGYCHIAGPLSIQTPDAVGGLPRATVPTS